MTDQLDLEERMRIGIIGAGNVGTGVGRRLAQKGHDIVVSFARSAEELEAAAHLIGGASRVGSPEDAASHGEVVLLATPWGVSLDLVRRLAPRLAGKILWDTTNPLRPDMSGLEVGTTTSGGEEIARRAPEAKVVKAVVPFAQVLHSPSTEISGHRPGVFVCGDDKSARETIVRLVNEIGADGIEAGPLSVARYTEPLGMLLVHLAYGQGLGARIGSVLIRETPIAKDGT